MGKQRVALFAFNRGLVSKRAQARVDLDRVALSADVMTNWRPETLGPMALRVGTEYLLNSGSSQPSYQPFVKAADDVALLEFTDGEMRVVVDDEPLAFGAVVAAVSNGDFDPDLTGWTDADDSGATSEYSGTAGSVVWLSNRTVYDFEVGDTAIAKYKADGDGTIYTQRQAVDGGVYQPVTGEWMLSGAAGDYSHRYIIVSGTATSGTFDTWLDGATDREVTRESPAVNGINTLVFDHEIRLDATGAILITARITLKARRQH